MAQSFNGSEFNGQVVRVQDLISLQVQIDFEEAEILGNESCYANNWDSYKQVQTWSCLLWFGKLWNLSLGQFLLLVE